MLHTICKDFCEEALIEAIIDEDLEVKIDFKIGTGCQKKMINGAAPISTPKRGRSWQKSDYASREEAKI